MKMTWQFFKEMAAESPALAALMMMLGLMEIGVFIVLFWAVGLWLVVGLGLLASVYGISYFIVKMIGRDK